MCHQWWIIACAWGHVIQGRDWMQSLCVNPTVGRVTHVAHIAMLVPTEIRLKCQIVFVSLLLVTQAWLPRRIRPHCLTLCLVNRFACDLKLNLRRWIPTWRVLCVHQLILAICQGIHRSHSLPHLCLQQTPSRQFCSTEMIARPPSCPDLQALPLFRAWRAHGLSQFRWTICNLNWRPPIIQIPHSSGPPQLCIAAR